MIYHGGPLDGEEVRDPTDEPMGEELAPAKIVPPDASGYYEWRDELQTYAWVDRPPPSLDWKPYRGDD